MSRLDKAVALVDSTPKLDRADIVIIGNGIAGLTAALEARRLAPHKRIVMMSEQLHPTIHTPALKQFTVGKLSRDHLLAYPAGTERAERLHIVRAHVEQIYAQSKYVALDGGRGFGYDSLLIATGSTPVGLPAHLPGREFDGILTLHRLHDYLNLRRRLREVSQAVVIGSGAHAVETAMSLQHCGISVTWLLRGPTVLPHTLDSPASQMVLERVRRAGIRVSTETEVVGIVGHMGTVAGVVTNAHQMLPCQLLVACTGTQAVMTLAQHCTLPMRHEKGIVVDQQLQTSVQDIYAAGDVAALHDPLIGRWETRAQWSAAVWQGRRVGAVLAEHEGQRHQPLGVPWHATQLGDLSLLTVGHPLTQNDRTAMLTKTSQGGYRRLAMVGQQLVGYLSLGPTPPDSFAMKRIIDDQLPVGEHINELLKGTFDARKYFSQQQTRVTHSMISIKPALRSIPNPVSQVQLLPMKVTIPATEPLLLTDVLSAIKREGKVPVEQYEEIGSFTGKLPALPRKM